MKGESTWRPVAIVASREVKEKIADRKFVLSTVALVVVVVGLVVGPAILQHHPSYSVGVAPSVRHAAGTALAPFEAMGVPVSLRVTSEAVARSELLDGDLDAYVASPTRVVLPREPSETLTTALQQTLSGMSVHRTVTDHDLDAGIAQELLAAASPRIETVSGPGDDGAAREVAARIAVFLLFGQISTYAFWVASGVVEEKSNRVVELIVSAVRPWQLLTGKIVGLGVLGLGQLLLTGAAGLSAAVVMGTIRWDGNLVTSLAVSLVAYALGFVFYASLYAAAASTVSRQEELGSVTGVVQAVLMGSLVVSFMALEPGSAPARVAAWLPMTSPLVAPPQLLAGQAGLASVLGAALLLLACVAAVIPVAARLYARAVLHTGARLSLRSAWRHLSNPTSTIRTHP